MPIPGRDEHFNFYDEVEKIDAVNVFKMLEIVINIDLLLSFIQVEFLRTFVFMEMT